MIALLIKCESMSEHPIAKSLISKLSEKSEQHGAESLYSVQNFEMVEGCGLVATISSSAEPEAAHKVLCGNLGLMQRFKINLDFNKFRENVEGLEREGRTVVCCVVDGQVRLLISLEEEHVSKKEAQEVVSSLLNDHGIKVGMITGDNQHAATRVANHLGIAPELVYFKASPTDKKNVIMRLEKEGERVMFVGDGVNDSPAMAQANIGVAINASTDITVQAASIVLMSNDLKDVLRALTISSRTLRQIKLNFLWAFIYNIVLVPIAMGLLYLWPAICAAICG